jgi:hypothetical protein
MRLLLLSLRAEGVAISAQHPRLASTEIATGLTPLAMRQ